MGGTRSGWYTPPPPARTGLGYPTGSNSRGVPDTLRAVCLLRSRSRTFYVQILDGNFVSCLNLACRFGSKTFLCELSANGFRSASLSGLGTWEL